MSATTAAPVSNQNTLVGRIAMGGLIIAALRSLDTFLFYFLLFQVPFIVQYQFIASGLLGESAFAGGVGTMVLGLVFHLVFSGVIAAVFMLAAARLPVLRRNIIVGGLLYGVVVYFVMNWVVTPLSAAPPQEVVPVVVIEGIIGHALLVGLPLALVARRNADDNM